MIQDLKIVEEPEEVPLDVMFAGNLIISFACAFYCGVDY